jgi:hypothetical protein
VLARPQRLQGQGVGDDDLGTPSHGLEVAAVGVARAESDAECPVERRLVVVAGGRHAVQLVILEEGEVVGVDEEDGARHFESLAAAHQALRPPSTCRSWPVT